MCFVLLMKKKPTQQTKPKKYTELPISLVSFFLWVDDQRFLFLDFSSLSRNNLEGRVESLYARKLDASYLHICNFSIVQFQLLILLLFQDLTEKLLVIAIRNIIAKDDSSLNVPVISTLLFRVLLWRSCIFQLLYCALIWIQHQNKVPSVVLHC